ncbi:Polysaccharide pyruvyl transferase [Salipiger thiooxidans]|uniref:Polysaccharide pyruvyl transferase n=1 Tax=Salipiger thiooxidans TaxID=282683 RepID=A0A1G7LM31_9RHOB|nr:polysaccharide pyruvyl transferase family protein [Salipiger thiooxidans]SDF50471.1 Polysaccharide pyruvyl transferase [Salipiger thiooxidans]
MTPHIQIRSFVLGGNHGQFLQAAGLLDAVSELRPDARVTQAGTHNHLGRELKVQARMLLLPKFLYMQWLWRRQIPMSAKNEAAAIRVYGSDQVWSFTNPAFDADPYFFGQGDDAEKVAYAPSMGYVPDDFQAPDWMVEGLQRFKAISVRDEGTKAVIERVTGRDDITLVSDPAFFLKEARLPDEATRDGGLAIYCTKPRLLLEQVMASAGGKMLDGVGPVRCYGYAPKRQALQQLPQQFVSPRALVRHYAKARFVLTSTFHGVVMALMTGTPYLALHSPNLEARLQSPVGRAGVPPWRMRRMEEMKDISAADMERLMSPEGIDRAAITREVEASRAWLGRALGATGE